MDGQVKIVAKEELKEMMSSRRTVLLVVFFSLWFGLINPLTTISSMAADSITSDFITAQMFTIVPLIGAMMAYVLTSGVFSSEKFGGIMESLLCTPLSLRSLWVGKLIAVVAFAIPFAVLALGMYMLVPIIVAGKVVLPSAIILLQVVITMPLFALAMAGVIGYTTLIMGMRESSMVSMIAFFVMFFGSMVLGPVLTGAETVNLLVVLVSAAVGFVAFMTINRLAMSIDKERVILTSSTGIEVGKRRR